MLGGPPRIGRRARTLRLDRPVVADLDGAAGSVPGARRGGSTRRGTRRRGADGLAEALDRLAAAAVTAARGGAALLVRVRPAALDSTRLPVPSILAVGAVNTALTDAGLRGRTDILAEAADVLDVHGLAMALAVGATAVVPWLAVELAVETAGSRGAEELTADAAVDNLLAAFEAGLRKTLARMGISTIASYVGGLLFETLELDDELRRPLLPGGAGVARDGRTRGHRGAAAASCGGRVDHRRRPAVEPPARPRVRPVPRRRRGPPVLAEERRRGHRAGVASSASRRSDRCGARALSVGARRLRARSSATACEFAGRRRRPPSPSHDVEPARDIVRRFVVSAMSVGALSPEAHQALTIGIQRAGGAANTGEGGEDPAWYVPTASGERHDARIKQVASARFGVTAQYLARADQLEIKIAQGSKPGEGGQLPAKKATAYIAMLRRGQPAMSYISPPPHHDIYSIEDLAQLIADLRAINPAARIGVKLVATRGRRDDRGGRRQGRRVATCT